MIDDSGVQVRPACGRITERPLAKNALGHLTCLVTKLVDDFVACGGSLLFGKLVDESEDSLHFVLPELELACHPEPLLREVSR